MIGSMIKKGAILCVVSVVLVLVVLFVFPDQKYDYEREIEEQAILQEKVDIDKPITLNLDGNQVSLRVWDKDEISVSQSRAHLEAQQEEVKLTFADNILDGQAGVSYRNAGGHYFFRSNIWIPLYGYVVQNYCMPDGDYNSIVDYYVTLPRGSHVKIACRGYGHSNELTVEDIWR